MSGPGVGYEWASDISWLKKDVLLFAVSIGCSSKDELHFLYENHPDFAVFPTYPILFTYKGNSHEVTDFYKVQSSVEIPAVPKFDWKRMVDGQRMMQFLKPLPPTSAGREFEVRSKVMGVYDKGKAGSIVETEQLLVDKRTGEVYTRAIGSAFFMGQGGWGGPKGSSPVNYPPPKGREQSPDKVSEMKLTDETAHLYRLNGDYNILHATPEPGKKMGFGGTIMHGLYSWNASAHMLLRDLGGSNPANMKEFQARFSAPVKPGSKLVVKMWKTGQFTDGFEDIRFVTEVNGKPVLTNGRAFVRSAAGKTKL